MTSVEISPANTQPVPEVPKVLPLPPAAIYDNPVTEPVPPIDETPIPTQRPAVEDTPDIAPLPANENEDIDIASKAAWALVTQIRQGGAPAKSATSDLYRVMWKALIPNVASKLSKAGLSDPATAEHITHEVILHGLGQLDKLQYGSPEAWFKTIARNKVTDYLRSLQREPISLTSLQDDSGEINESKISRSYTDTDADPEQASMQEDLRTRMDRALTALGQTRSNYGPNTDQEECLRLRFLEGLTVEETAERLGINAAAARSLQLRARKNLASILRRTDPGIVEYLS